MYGIKPDWELEPRPRHFVLDDYWRTHEQSSEGGPYYVREGEMVVARPASPPSDLVGLYSELHGRYQALYPALRPTFQATD